MKKELVRATVISCEPSENVIRGTVVPCYEIEFEYFTPTGNVRKSIKRGTAMEVGTSMYLDCYENGTIEQADGKIKKAGNPQLVVGVLLGITMLVIIGVALLKFGQLNKWQMGILMGILLSLVFIFLGFYIAVIFPKKRRNVQDCILVEGKVIKNVKTNNGILWTATYSALYEYWYNGERRKVGSVSDSRIKKAIGKKVTIAVNKNTEEAFCLQEQKNFYWGGGIFAAASFAFLVAFIIELFKM